MPERIEDRSHAGVISDFLSVRTNLEVKTAGMGVLAITLRAEQTPITLKFGIKNGISDAKNSASENDSLL